MPLDVRIISGGSTYYLVNSSGTPTAGGSATGASTTPYSLEAAEWTQTAAPRQVIYSGGPPFRVGSSPLYAGYGNVTEALGIGIMASSADNMASLIRTLRRILNTAVYSTPALLYWLPSGATSPVYFEIYSGDVQEVGDWNNPSAGFTQALIRVTITRSAVGGRLGSGENLFSGTAVTNNSGATNLVSLGSSGAGDLVNEGQPMNVTFTPAGASTNRVGALRLGVVNARTRNTTNTGTATASTVAVVQDYAFTLNPSTVPPGCDLRIIVCYTSTRPSATLVRATVSIEAENASPAWTPIYQSPKVQCMGTAGQASATDLGGVDSGALARMVGATDIDLVVTIVWYITDGVSTTITRNSMDLIQAYTWCQATWGPSTGYAIDGAPAVVYGYQEVSGMAAIPLPTPQAWITASGRHAVPGVIRGTAPRYVPGASLYIQWLTGTAQNWYSANTGTLTATQAPVYLTLRGAG